MDHPRILDFILCLESNGYTHAGILCECSSGSWRREKPLQCRDLRHCFHAQTEERNERIWRRMLTCQVDCKHLENLNEGPWKMEQFRVVWMWHVAEQEWMLEPENILCVWILQRFTHSFSTCFSSFWRPFLLMKPPAAAFIRKHFRVFHVWELTLTLT